MKNIVILIAALVLHGTLASQNRLSVTDSKVTHLVCPDRVSYLQVGDPGLVLAEIPDELPNLVRIKATGPFDRESSLTVVCRGQIYSFLVDYEDTGKITHQLEHFDSEKAGCYRGGVLPDYVLKSLSDRLLDHHRKRVKRRKAKKDGMQFRLRSIYLKGDALFVDLEITNQTNLAYEVEGFHWWVDDRRQRKATNVQEYEIQPLYQRYRVKTIPAKTSIREVVVLPKLTIPDGRILRVELLEHALGNTGRKLSLEIKNKDILKARALKGY